MIREIVKPNNNNLVINIPDEYIGQEIEYIVFPLHKDIKENSNEDIDIDSIAGILNKYADPSKIELEDKAWELHVMEKFAKRLFY
jgi:hypothetical protein